jgi:hypothetical protein
MIFMFHVDDWQILDAEHDGHQVLVYLRNDILFCGMYRCIHGCRIPLVYMCGDCGDMGHIKARAHPQKNTGTNKYADLHIYLHVDASNPPNK